MADLPRTILVATVQMDVTPTPVDERLCRAEEIAGNATRLGAELVVLPELFNTGYAYTNDNFHHAEMVDGPTIHWLKRTARLMNIHLAGTLLLVDGGEIFNSMFIVAPDGQSWRYDKSFPWGWERGYFRGSPARGGARATVAQTSLGDLGILICWDIAHPALWAAYAGQVDLVFGEMLCQQTAWLGIPAANSSGCGTFDSPLPDGQGSLLAMLPFAPWLERYLPQADRLRITAGLVDCCQIVSAQGQQLAHRPQHLEEGFCIMEVALNEKRQPGTRQPAAPVSRLAYLFSDTFLSRLMLPTYRRGIREIPATF
jgi:hypothetical protein